MTRRRAIFSVIGGLVLAPALGWGLYATVIWLSFGKTRSNAASDQQMALYMPRYDIAELHQTRVRARPSVTFEAARGLDLQQSRVVHAIFRGRELMLRAKPPATAPRVPLIDEMLSIGWGVLADRPGRYLVLGAIAQPWKADVGFRALRPDAFATFDSAGYVKLVVIFAVDSIGPHESVFRTETRALATDPVSRAKFRRYWSVFSPGILLIRSAALKLVRRDAERMQARLADPSGT